MADETPTNGTKPADETGTSFLKTVFKILAIVVVVCIVGLGVLYALFPTERVKDEAHRVAREQIHRDVEIGDVGLSFWPIGFTIADVVVPNQPGFGGDPLFTLGEFVIDIDLGALVFERMLKIDRIIVREPRITYIIRPDGTTNADGLGPPEEEMEPEEGIEPEEPGIEVEAEVELEEGEALPFGFTLSEFRIVDGSFHLIDQMNGMDARVGSFNQFVTVQIDTTLNPIIADGDLRLDGITVQSSDLSLGPVSFHLNHVTRTSIPDDSTWFRITINAMDIPIAFVGDVQNMSTDPEVVLDLETGEIDLARLGRNLAGVSPELATLNLAGQVLMNFHLHQAPDPEQEAPRLDFNGGVQFREISAAVPGLEVPVDRVHGDITFDQDEVSIPDIVVKAGSTEVHLADVIVRDFMTFGEEGAPPLTARFALRGPMINVDELIVIPEDTAEVEPMADTTVIFAMSPFPAAVVNGVVDIGAIKFSDLLLTQVRSNLSVEGQRAAVDLRSRLYNGSIGGDAFLDVADTTDVRYGTNWNVANVEANDLLSVLTSFDDRFYGRATSTGRITGHGNTYGELKQNLNGAIDLNAGNGRIVNAPVVQRVSQKVGQGVDRVKSGWGTNAVHRMGLDREQVEYGELTGSWTIENGRLIIRSLDMTVRDQVWDTRGWISLSGPMDLVTSLTFSEDITMELAGSAASAVSSIYSIGASDLAATLEPPNHLRVDIPIRGTTDDPDVGMPNLLAPLPERSQERGTAGARQGSPCRRGTRAAGQGGSRAACS